MMLTPAAPRAGPIGGAGLAFPAGIESSPKADQQSKAKAEPAPLGSGAAAAGATA